MKMPRWIANLFYRRFERGLETALDRANRLHSKRGPVVVCSYCGGLLPKSEAGSEYDLETDKLTYCHETCFDKYAPHGTLEDLERAALGEEHSDG